MMCYRYVGSNGCDYIVIFVSGSLNFIRDDRGGYLK